MLPHISLLFSNSIHLKMFASVWCFALTLLLRQWGLASGSTEVELLAAERSANVVSPSKTDISQFLKHYSLDIGLLILY